MFIFAALPVFAQDEDARILVLDGKRPPPPFFFAAEAETVLTAGLGGVEHQSEVVVRVLQGRPDRIALGFSGDAVVESVEGEPLAAWAVKEEREDGLVRRFLELIPGIAEDAEVPERMTYTVRARSRVDALPMAVPPAVLSGGRAAGFSGRLVLRQDAEVEALVADAAGLLPTADERGDRVFLVQGPMVSLLLGLGPADAQRSVEVVSARLGGRVDAAARVVRFVADLDVRAIEAGAVLPVLRGGAALAGLPESAEGGALDGVGVRLSQHGGPVETALVFDAAGEHRLRLRFHAPVAEDGAARRVDFAWLAGAIVPLGIEGIEADAEMGGRADSLVLREDGSGRHAGFVPAGGVCRLTWTPGRRAAPDAGLFLNVESRVSLTATSGLLTQRADIDLRVLQGEMAALDFAMDGPGEIMGVEGAAVADWALREEDGARVLGVRFTTPQKGGVSISVRAQTALGEPPARTSVLRLTPVLPQVRSSGYLRVAGRGAVRIEVADPEGLMQLSPTQWPMRDEVEAEGARQVFVFRFPTPDYSCEIVVDQIVAETTVNQVLVYDLDESDRRITASLELDIREAPLREWDLLVPAGYSLVAADGQGIADTVLGGEDGEGRRRLKVIFAEAVSGRRLIQLRLERNEPAAAGKWSPVSLRFPGARSARGFLGVAAAPGFRLQPTAMDGLAESPLALFPGSAERLQHAFRIREDDWSVEIGVEALGRNVQADLFHLHTLREGGASASVLANFFIVGAPVSEWRFEVPEAAANLAVDGHDVRAWRREDNTVVVTMERPALGAATILLTYEEALDPRGAKFSPGQTRPLDVEGERGFIQVASALQVRLEVAETGSGLLKLEASELPGEFAVLALSPSLAVFQYTERPAPLVLAVDWFPAGETAPQIIDFASLSSQFSWDGQVVTESRWFVKSRGSDSLRLRLPEGAELWEVTAGGERVNARSDGGQTVVPLPPSRDAMTPVEVVLRYGEGEGGGRRTLVAPTAEVPVVMGDWELKADREHSLIVRGGNATTPAEGQMKTAMAQLLGSGAWVAVLGIGVLAAAALLCRGRRLRWVGALALLAAVGLAALCVLGATFLSPDPVRFLRFEAPVVPAGGEISIAVSHVPDWRAGVSGFGLFLVVAGAALLAAAVIRPERVRLPGNLALAAGATLMASGLLGQAGGLPWFFALLGAAALAICARPVIGQWRKQPDAA